MLSLCYFKCTGGPSRRLGRGRLGKGIQARVLPKLKSPRICGAMFWEEPKFTLEKINIWLATGQGSSKLIENMAEVDICMYIEEDWAFLMYEHWFEIDSERHPISGRVCDSEDNFEILNLKSQNTKSRLSDNTSDLWKRCTHICKKSSKAIKKLYRSTVFWGPNRPLWVFGGRGLKCLLDPSVFKWNEAVLSVVCDVRLTFTCVTIIYIYFCIHSGCAKTLRTHILKIP